jgi:hypothetical protein
MRSGGSTTRKTTQGTKKERHHTEEESSITHKKLVKKPQTIHPTQRCTVEVQRPGKPHRHNRVQRKNNTIWKKKAPLHTKTSKKNHVRERFLDRSLERDFKDFNTPYLFLLFLFVLTYNFVLCRFTILTSPDSNGSVGSSDCLLYIIVVTLEDGHHEGSKHVV